VLEFHDPIPDVREQVCDALLVKEYWYRGELASEANVLFLRLNDVWHRFFIDAGVVFWKTVEAPDPPADEAEHSFRLTDIGAGHGLMGRRLSAIEAIDLPGGGALRLAFEGGPTIILNNQNDASRLIVERDGPASALTTG